MKKLKHLIILSLFVAVSVSAVSGFFIDSSKLAYTVGTKTDKVQDNFDKSYKLNSKIEEVESSVQKEVEEVTKKATNLLLGDFNNTNESGEKYFQRYKKYKDLIERVYKCSKCQNEIDRDLNASINIMYEGVKLYMKKLII